MRPALCVVALLALVTPAFAANRFVGTWKMNTQKSSGPETPTAEQLVAIDEGAERLITVSGTAPDGSTRQTKFSIPIQGGKGKIIEAAPFTAVHAKAYTASTEDFMFTTEDKPAMHIHSVLSSDGKVMTTTRQVMSGPSKPALIRILGRSSNLPAVTNDDHALRHSCYARLVLRF